jgi:hypothetical protein
MTFKKEFEQALRQELRDVMPNVILPLDNGDYELFGKYRIMLQRPGYLVMCYGTEVGIFNSTRTAVSWCVADKYKDYTLAQNILILDNKLGFITNDIQLRANLADRSRAPEFRESVGIKLETKLIRKKIVENQLANCINLAKYLQQRGFNNETARTGRSQPNKTSR